MNLRVCAALASLAATVAMLLSASPAGAAGSLGYPRGTSVGSFGGISYIQYDGLFSGHTSTGTYRVPYRITAPAQTNRGNRTVLVEPPHFAIGLGALNVYLRRDLLFPRGFTHAGVGWSTTSFGAGFDQRILDPTVPGVFINGGVLEENGRTDDEIIVDFASALAVDGNAQAILGRVARRYLTGLSDSSDTVLRLVTSGQAARLFDFALPFTASGFDPQTALVAGLYDGKLIVVDSEIDDPAVLIDRGVAPRQYRFYSVAGTPHIPDPLDSPSIANGSTPATYVAALRAHFLQGHRWVEHGTPPPPSTRLRMDQVGALVRDPNGNAISVDARRRVPRLPYVELGEARFISDFIGSFDNVKSIQALGFHNHHQYLKEFVDKVADYVEAGYMLDEDAATMRKRAALCPPLTFTETYRDHYDAFVASVPCRR